MPSNDDVLRIMISTDNHLGVWERDEVRTHDSFNAFEEVLQKANEMDVDMVLLGGDLFHENKPSRQTVVKAIAALKKHCLQRDRPIHFKIQSDTTKNFVSGVANYQDPSLTVGLPVFTIHGNHDDPTGADNLSAVDILSSCGLVNYFGKILVAGSGEVNGTVQIEPVLLTKGKTQVALYGLGNIRDERLGRMFRTAGCIKWQNEFDVPGCTPESWFNVFVLHQNRVQHGPKAKNCVTEDLLPTWLDLVVWGHEHECRPDAVEAVNPEAKASGADLPFILQPGSTVATALSEGEAARKHYFILEIMETQFRIQTYALESQRPFVYETVCLKDVSQPQPLRAEDQEGITTFLEAKVNDMIKRATANATGSEPKLPLIRLKVDYTGFTTINAQRFGQKFVGKVANPHDILTWSKSLAKRVKDEAGGTGSMMDADLLRPEALDQARIEDLIQENLQERLKLLTEEELGLALHSYVDKDEKLALAECVTAELAARMRGAAIRKVLPSQLSDLELQDQLIAAVVADRDDKDALLTAKAELASDAHPVGGLGGDDDMDVDFEPAGRGGGSKAKAGTQRGSKAAASASQPAGRGRGRGQGKAAADKPTTTGRGTGRQLNVLEAFSLQASQRPAGGMSAPGATQGGVGDEEDEDFTADVPLTTTKRGASRASQPRAKASQAGKKHARDSDDIEDSDEAPAAKGKRGAAAGARSRTSQRTAAQPKKKPKLVDSDDDAVLSDDRDEDYVEVLSSEGGSSDEIDDEEEDDSQAGRGSKRGGKKAAGSKKAAPKKKSTAQGTWTSTRSSPRKASAGTAKSTGKVKSPGSTMVTSLAGATRAEDEDAITIGSTSDDEGENQGRAANTGGRQAAGSQRSTQASGPTQKGGRTLPTSFTGGCDTTAGRAAAELGPGEVEGKGGARRGRGEGGRQAR